MLKVKPGGRAQATTPQTAPTRSARGVTAAPHLSGNAAAQDDAYTAMLDEMDRRIADITARTDRLIARLS